jgi:MoaA/NifB/PqqE/SkfB family radical SAM enzyme
VLSRRDHYVRLSVCTAGVPAGPALRGLHELVDGGGLELYVSLDGVGSVHDRVRGRRGAFAEVEAFLHSAREVSGVTIALTCVINRLNVDALDDVADFAGERGLPISYAIVNQSDHYINSAPLFGKVSLAPHQVDQAIEFLGRRSSQRLNEDLIRVLLGGQRELPCRLLRDGFLVTSDGTVSICGTSRRMILGRLVETDPIGSWRAVLERRPDLLTQGARSVCSTCTTNCFAWRKSDGPVPA